jgi:hypothetical protein
MSAPVVAREVSKMLAAEMRAAEVRGAAEMRAAAVAVVNLVAAVAVRR